jgi:YVTN family beta-propeller protein
MCVTAQFAASLRQRSAAWVRDVQRGARRVRQALIAAILFLTSPSFAAPFVYVTNFSSGDVSVIDIATNAVVATVAVGPLPGGVAVTPNGSRVYVTHVSSNNVSVIDTATNTVIATVAVGVQPKGVAVNPSGTRAYVTNQGSSSVSVIDTATSAVVATVAVGVSPSAVAVNPAGTRAYVTNAGSNTMSVIDTATNTVIATVPGFVIPRGVIVNPAGSRIYVASQSGNNVSVIDSASNTVIAIVAVGTNANGVAINPAGTRVYVTNIGSSNVSVIDTATNTVVATVAAGDQPQGVVVNPAGTRVYVTNGTYNNVLVIDTATNAVIATVAVGIFPVAAGISISGPPATSPGAPTIGTATAGNAQATISFTPPASDGGSPITSYTVTSNPGGITATGAASPLTVTGLTNGTAYTFTVTATNTAGTGSASATTNSVTPVATETLWIRAQGPNGSNFVRQGQTGTYAAVLVRADGTIVDPVTPSWSITAGPATVNSSGVVTGGAVSVNTPATLSASFTDSVLTGGATVTSTQTLTIQPSQDRWTGGVQPGQGGDLRTLTQVGSDIVLAVYGGGIYRSTNSAVSWIQSGYGIPNRGSAFVRTLRAVPGLPTGNLLATVEGSGIYRSSDGGATWTLSNSGMGCNFPRILGVQGTTLYVASSCGVYKSIDGGNTWSATALTGPVDSVSAFGATAPGVVWARVAGAGWYRSVDGGATWEQRNTGLSGPNGLYAYAFNNLSNNVHLTQIEGSGMFKTNDAGLNWSPANTGLPAISAYSFHGGNIANLGGYLYVSVEGYGIYRGTTGGVSTDPITWSPWGNTATQLPLRARAPDVLISGVYYVGTGQGMYKSSDNGVTWTKFSTGLPGGFAHTSATDPTNTNIVYAAADTVYKSTDGGATWAQSANGITSAHTGQRGSNGTIIRRSDGALYVSTANGGIFKSVDGAANWTAVNSGLPAIVGQGVAVRGGLASAPQTLFALYSEDPHGVYMTVNGGASWTNISGDLAGSALRTNAIAVDANGELYLGTEGGLYKSVNGGTNWTAVYTATGVNHVRVDGGDVPSAVYWSTYVVDSFNTPHASSGVYRSLNGGSIFTQILSGYPVRNLRVQRPAGQLTLYAASWSLGDVTSGMLKSTDDGLTWATIKSGMSHRFVNSFDVVGQQLVHASTFGGGVFTFASATDIQPPTVPTGQGANAVSSSQINLSWDTSTDNVAVATYHVFRNGVQVATVNSQSLAFGDTGLTASTLYNYGVSACDAAGNCSAPSASAPATTLAPGQYLFAPTLEAGFNLIANSLNITLDVVMLFGNQDSPTAVTSNIVSIWKWNAADVRWAFNSPQLTVADNAAYAAAHNYEILSVINPGEGYWVNSIVPLTLPTQSGSGFNWNGINFAALPSGFNLITNADGYTPSQFNNQVSEPPPAQGAVPTTNFVSLWTWDALAGTWYFYSPLLESSGGLVAVKTYADSHFYRHFQDYGKIIGVGTGFWVNRP